MSLHQWWSDGMSNSEKKNKKKPKKTIAHIQDMNVHSDLQKHFH